MSTRSNKFVVMRMDNHENDKESYESWDIYRTDGDSFEFIAEFHEKKYATLFARALNKPKPKIKRNPFDPPMCPLGKTLKQLFPSSKNWKYAAKQECRACSCVWRVDCRTPLEGKGYCPCCWGFKNRMKK